jgi:hypothetical protein
VTAAGFLCIVRRNDAAEPGDDRKTDRAMIDNFSILVSTLMVLYIIWRAAKVDRVRPWFETRSLYEKAHPEETATRAAAAAAAKQKAGGGKPRVPIELLTHGSASRR